MGGVGLWGEEEFSNFLFFIDVFSGRTLTTVEYHKFTGLKKTQNFYFEISSVCVHPGHLYS